MSDLKRAREEEAGGHAAGGGGAAPPPAAAPSVPLTQDDALLVLGIVAHNLARLMRTGHMEAATACALSAAWAARPPRPDDDEGCLARARRSAELAAEHAQRKAAEAPKLLRIINKRVTGLCRDTWTCVPPGLSAADADRVRAEHPIWRAIIDLKHGWREDTRLLWALREGKLARVRELCDWHADIEVADSFENTPLYAATILGHLDIVCYLLERGASVNAADCCHESSMHVASDHGRLDIVRELLAHGADVDAVTKEDHSPLLGASAFGHVEVVRALLAAGANKRHVNVYGDSARDFAGISVILQQPGLRNTILMMLDAAP